MGLNNNYSDYGSGTSSNSGSPCGSMDVWPLAGSGLEPNWCRLAVQRSNSLAKDATSNSTLNVMEEFKRNGFDSPYEPEEDQLWSKLPQRLSGMGPPAGYLRQKSWPEPDRSPAPPLPRLKLRMSRPAPDSKDWQDTAPLSRGLQNWAGVPLKTKLPQTGMQDWPDMTLKRRATGSDWDDGMPKMRETPSGWQDRTDVQVAPKTRPNSLAGLENWSGLAQEMSKLSLTGAGEMEWSDFGAPFPQWDDVEATGPGAGDASISAAQLRVLQSLPDAVLFALLRDLGRARLERRGKRRPHEECRFCKNNGERETYYRSHALKGPDGVVTCPVLRAFVCRRCGASGDHAHTIKYCPLSTEEERNQSMAMMRSVRMASGRRRTNSIPPSSDAPPNNQLNSPTEAPPGDELWNLPPLGPEWVALEQKLML